MVWSESRPRRRRIVSVASLCVLFAIPWLLLAGAESRRGAAPVNTLGAVRIGTFGVERGGNLSRYRYVELNAWDHTLLPALREQNPKVRLLVYKDMASVRSYAVGDELVPSGVRYEDAKPEWFLMRGGQRLEWSGFPEHWWVDVGNSDYQAAWAENVISELRRDDWDGVTIDNAFSDPYTYGGPPDAYPTRALYRAAVDSFLAHVGPKLRAAGFLVIPNVSGTSVEETKKLLPYVSGVTQEHWTKWSGGGSGGHFADSEWAQMQRYMTTALEARKIFIAHTMAPPDDVRSMVYGRASFLLEWDGGPSAFTFDPNPDSDPWNPAWTSEIGLPRGPKVRRGVGWEREFTDGSVYVNPSSSQAQSFSAGLVLEPTTGLILPR
jgi:putative glycosyl hydrolase-like family 15 (GHL15) protein